MTQLTSEPWRAQEPSTANAIYRSACHEAGVREEPVVSGGHTEHGDCVAAHQQPDVEPGDRRAQPPADRQDGADKWHHRQGRSDQELEQSTDGTGLGVGIVAARRASTTIEGGEGQMALRSETDARRTPKEVSVPAIADESANEKSAP